MKKFFAISIIILLLASMGCSGGGSNGNGDSLTVTGEIGAEGGTIEVTDSESQMFHAKIVIPAGALDQDTVISLKIIDTTEALPGNLTQGGVIIEFSPAGTVFHRNISITIPYRDENNDGLVDNTGISENLLSVLYRNSSSQQWTNIDNIISRDSINNTITFETNHFTQYMAFVPKDISGSKVSIFAIDGMDFDRTYKSILYNAILNYPARVEYLCAGILQANILNISKDDCYSFTGTGTNSGESWDGDATKTFGYLDELTADLTQKAQQAKNEGKKFIVITHSWGTQLATLGLSMSSVEPDLFITLSDPEGSSYVNTANYTNEFFSIIPPLSVSTAQTLIWDLVHIYGVSAVSSVNVKAKKWINYWDVGDIISGPIVSIHTSNAIEDRTVINCTERSSKTTNKVHSITSLNESFWTDGSGVTQETGDLFRNRIISDILQAM